METKIVEFFFNTREKYLVVIKQELKIARVGLAGWAKVLAAKTKQQQTQNKTKQNKQPWTA